MKTRKYFFGNEINLSCSVSDTYKYLKYKVWQSITVQLHSIDIIRAYIIYILTADQLLFYLPIYILYVYSIFFLLIYIQSFVLWGTLIFMPYKHAYTYVYSRFIYYLNVVIFACNSSVLRSKKYVGYVQVIITYCLKTFNR